MENVIVLLGKNGAGKGTRLKEFLKGREDQFDAVSVGDLLRKAREDNTELGQKAANYMDSGLLVPDDLINALVIEGLQNAKKPIFMDGFPRTVPQAEAMLRAGICPLVIEFYVDDEVVFERARNRIVCKSCGATYTLNNFDPPKKEGICDNCGGKLGKRSDDQEETVLKRLNVYKKDTYPVLGFLESYGIRTFTIDNHEPDSARRLFAEIVLSSLDDQ